MTFSPKNGDFLKNIVKKNIPILDLLPWKTEVLRLLTAKCENLKNRLTISDIPNPLTSASTKLCLEDLQNKFVMCPTDKAANNVSFVCKRLYAKILFEELKQTKSKPN